MFRPSFEKCAEHFEYNPKTGIIFWKKPTASRIKAGDRAGSIRNDGYLRVSFSGGIVAQHRLAWLLHYGEWPQGDVDHINRVRDDNRIENLRVVTPSENAKNREYRKPGQMRHGGKGITRRDDFWQVQVHCPRRGAAIYGGIFRNKSEAAEKAENMRREFDL